ncbi:peptidoglycan-binding protein, partial [Candidatus Gracilibacteria bacterium]|nr:peptidoglycan-binding protein [Candidatus Gracilibacteria bacterium]
MTYSSNTRQYFVGLCFVILVALMALPSSTNAQTTSTTTPTASENSLALIQSLMKQIEDLKAKLATLRGEVRSELKDGLKEGMTDEDVKKIQELLATDPTLYPRGLVTGYYGPMTKEAVLRFQARHELRTSGEVDAETKALILEYFKERTNGQIPPGLLRAPGIDKKIKLRLQEGENGRYELKCENKKGAGFLCKEKFKNNDHDED